MNDLDRPSACSLINIEQPDFLELLEYEMHYRGERDRLNLKSTRSLSRRRHAQYVDTRVCSIYTTCIFNTKIMNV